MKKLFFRRNKFFFLLFFLFILVLPSKIVQAFSCPNLNKNPTFTHLLDVKFDNLCGLVQVVYNFISLLKTIGGGFFSLMIIIAGIRYATAGGNPENIQKAKRALSAAIIGLVVFILSYSIVKIIKTAIS